MTATAHMLDRFNPTLGIDRVYVSELWHVKGVGGANAVQWTRATTNQVVFGVIPVTLGQTHADGGLRTAHCTAIRLIDGPWVQSDGTYEGIVQVLYDSDRRWGGAFYEAPSITVEDDFEIPTWHKGVALAGGNNEWIAHSIPHKRSKIVRIEPRDATGITEAEKALVFTYVGKPYNLFGIPYILRNSSIYRMRTNQTILRYTFESTAPVKAFGIDEFPGMGVATPALDCLDEYARVYTNPPTIGKKLGRSYSPTGNYGDPTFLPYWNRKILP